MYHGYHPSNATPVEVADSVSELVNTIREFTESILVFGIPTLFPPDQERELTEAHIINRYEAFNWRLHNSSEVLKWSYRGPGDAVWSTAKSSDWDNAHINENGLSHIQSIFRKKIQALFP